MSYWAPDPSLSRSERALSWVRSAEFKEGAKRVVLLTALAIVLIAGTMVAVGLTAKALVPITSTDAWTSDGWVGRYILTPFSDYCDRFVHYGAYALVSGAVILLGFMIYRKWKGRELPQEADGVAGRLDGFTASIRAMLNSRRKVVAAIVFPIILVGLSLFFCSVTILTSHAHQTLTAQAHWSWYPHLDSTLNGMMYGGLVAAGAGVTIIYLALFGTVLQLKIARWRAQIKAALARSEANAGL